MRRELSRTDAPWPTTLILVTGAMLLTAWFPPLWFLVLPPILAVRREVKRKYLAERQWALYNAQMSAYLADDRAFIAAMRSA